MLESATPLLCDSIQEFHIEDDLSLLNWLVISNSDEIGLPQNNEDMLVRLDCLQVLGEKEPSSLLAPWLLTDTL